MNSFNFWIFSTISSLFEESWRYIIFGFIQGITEFIPISSTAHLKVIPLLLGWEDPGVSISASLQLGSIIAVMTYFWKDLKFILRGILNISHNKNWNKKNTKLFLAILFGTLPIILVGMLIKLFWNNYETSFIRTIPFIATISIVMGVALFKADFYGRKKKSLDNFTLLDGFLIGCSQVLALIPGVSRSGITITTALMSGWGRDSAARFSFLLGIPAITVAGLVEFREVIFIDELFISIPLVLGIISSGLFSWLAIDFLLKFLQKNNIMIIVAYRVLFGVLLLFWYF